MRQETRVERVLEVARLPVVERVRLACPPLHRVGLTLVEQRGGVVDVQGGEVVGGRPLDRVQLENAAGSF